MKKYWKEANNLLSKFNVDIDCLDRYDEPHRFYHNWNHIEYMLSLAQKSNILTNELFLAILFHDIIYDPKSSDNEEKSAELFYILFKNSGVNVELIMQAIFDTKHHISSSELSKQLCELDLYNLYNDFDVFYENCINIFKEYQFVDYKVYKIERRKFLEKYNINPIWIKAVDNFRPKIGVYAGSFNKFHKGHLNILTKAEQIFDKVIIARGVNSEKDNEIHPLPDYLKYRQIEYYDGLLTDFIDSLGYDVTLIRGLRNATDLQYEMMQLQYMRDFKPDIKVVNIPCDKEFEHISSSSIRLLEKYGKVDKYL
jgi:pantetheine-phosphate adenylyltransferase